jgi:hypothetical protein
MASLIRLQPNLRLVENTPRKTRPEPSAAVVDLEALLHPVGKPATLTAPRRLILVAGLGGTGKTEWCKWYGENGLSRDVPLALATIDPSNRTLQQFFISEETGETEVTAPDPGQPGSGFLKDFLSLLDLNAGVSGVVDIGGGGEVAVISVLEGFGGGKSVITQLSRLQASPIDPVLIIMLAPRVESADVIATFRRTGFQPPATILVKNLGVAKSERALEGMKEFAPIEATAAYKAAVADGAIALWMPRLPSETAELIRSGGWNFAEARKYVGLANRLDLEWWLQTMQLRFNYPETYLL